jgi:hypothetical protein
VDSLHIDHFLERAPELFRGFSTNPISGGRNTLVCKKLDFSLLLILLFN